MWVNLMRTRDPYCSQPAELIATCPDKQTEQVQAAAKAINFAEMQPNTPPPEKTKRKKAKKTHTHTTPRTLRPPMRP